MPRRRPVLRNAGAVVLLTTLALPLAGCGDENVAIAGPKPTGETAKECGALVDALPDAVDDLLRRPVTPKDAAGAAWGDPAIVLRCGVPEPKGFTKYSTCQIVDGVAWFIPDVQITGAPVDITMTTVGRSANVEVRLPKEYFPPAQAMVDLAPAIKRTTTNEKPCG